MSVSPLKKQAFKIEKGSRNINPFWSGIAFMLLGGSFMLGAAVIINRAVETEKEPLRETKIVNFHIQNMSQSKKRHTSEIKAQEKPKKISQQKINASPSLTSALPGLDFGLGGEIERFDRSLTDSNHSDEDAAVMSSESLDSPPRALRSNPVEYPSQAREQKLNGYVSVNILISEQGKVEKIMVQDSEPRGVFDQAVIDSLRSWQFEPAKYKGRSVKVWASQRIVFGEST